VAEGLQQPVESEVAASPLAPPTLDPRPPRWLVGLTIGFAAMLVTGVLMLDYNIGRSFFLSVRVVPGGDKTMHFVLMGSLALLLNVVLRGQRFEIGPILVLRGSLIVGVIVTAEEISQLYVKSRNFSPDDLFYDYLGILLLGQVGNAIAWWRRRRAAQAVAAAELSSRS
jgi:hypothetical protein